MQITYLHDSVTWPCQSYKTDVAQNICICQKSKEPVKNSKVTKIEPLGIDEWDFIEVWSFEKLQRFVWKMLLEGEVCHPATFPIQILSFKFARNLNYHKNSLLNAKPSDLAILLFLKCSFDFWHLFCITTVFYDWQNHMTAMLKAYRYNSNLDFRMKGNTRKTQAKIFLAIK